jgi:cell division protein FtsI (penicillin-binding protein 3)
MIKKRKTKPEFFELSNFRRRFTILILLTLFLTLFSRAFYLQSMQSDSLQAKGGDITNRKEELHAYRGKILDRNNELLAASTPVETIVVNLPDLTITIDQKKRLASLLEMHQKTLTKRLNKRGKHTIYLKRSLSPKIAGKIMALKIPGIYTLKEYDRFYPGKEASAHVVGFTSIDGDGLEGIEMYANKILSGVPGFRKVLKNRSGKIVDDLQDIQIPIDGKDIKLSVDKRLQYSSYKALEKAVEKHGALSGSSILIDAKTGEVLAMTNYPSFNPNPKASSRDTEYVRNRVVTDVFEPGSTIKPITVSAALKDNTVKPDDLINTFEGFYKVRKGFTVRDTKSYGLITVKEVIQKSSNIGTTQISQKLEPKYLWNVLNEYGLGKKTGIEFPGEVKGVIHHHKNWGESEQATISYGYGISSSLIQLAQAYTVFANQGEIKPITLLKTDGPVIGRKVLDKRTSNQMLNILESVITPEGTGILAKIPGYRVAGKTGTAKKSSKGGYGNKYIGSFIGIAPVSNPKFILAVMIDEPSIDGYYGGVVAGPAFQSIMSDALKLYSIPQDGKKIAPSSEQKMVLLKN